RGIGLSPTTSANTGEGCIAFMKAAFGLRLVPLFFAEFFFTVLFAAIRFGSPPLQGTLVGFVLKPERASYQFLRGKNSLSTIFSLEGIGFPQGRLAFHLPDGPFPVERCPPCERSSLARTASSEPG